jgi:hypothetical protein
VKAARLKPALPWKIASSNTALPSKTHVVARGKDAVSVGVSGLLVRLARRRGGRVPHVSARRRCRFTADVAIARTLRRSPAEVSKAAKRLWGRSVSGRPTEVTSPEH